MIKMFPSILRTLGIAGLVSRNTETVIVSILMILIAFLHATKIRLSSCVRISYYPSQSGISVLLIRLNVSNDQDSIYPREFLQKRVEVG